MSNASVKTAGAKSGFDLRKIGKSMYRDRYLYIMILLPVALLVVFRYLPMYGVLIAFQDYKLGTPILSNKIIGFKHFDAFINGPFFVRLMRNTFLLGLYSLVIGFPLPIILALSFNEVKNGVYKKVAQTASYLPYFVSTVVIVGILKNLMDVETGKLNDIIAFFGFPRIKFFAESSWFRTIYIGSGIWQSLGYSAIIYLAALAGVEPEQYESATIDGASRFQKIVHISVPSIMPTVLVLLILSVGGILGNDVQKILLIYDKVTYETADVIGTYMFRRGIQNTEYSLSAAVGLFINVISFFFLFGANWLNRKFGESSLW